MKNEEEFETKVPKRFSDLATGLPEQTLDEVEAIKSSFPIIISILQICGVEKERREDKTILEIAAFHWVNHFANRLESGAWSSSEIAFLFLKLFNDSYVGNFKERLERLDHTQVPYHLNTVFPREREIHRKLSLYLKLREHLVPIYEIGTVTRTLS